MDTQAKQALTRAQLLKRMRLAREKVVAHMSEGKGMYARGLASEGYNGGYLAALDDVEALLRHGMPRDDRGFWK